MADSPKTVNLALSAVRRVLNLAAREWRDEHGLTWLQTAPLISMLPVTDARAPYPLSWQEQRLLFQELPAHLARMALFKFNTGTRDQKVCGLRWEWEIRIPELDTSLFLIPGKFVKNREDRVVVLNAVAKRVIDEVRGTHPDQVFTYQGNALETRKVLLGHTTGDIISHYSAPELHELIEAVNRVRAGDSGKTPALTLIKTKSG